MSRKLVGSLVAASLLLTGLVINPALAATSAPVLVKDLETSPAGTSPEGFVEHEGKLYFSATDSAKGRELFAKNLSTGAVQIFDVNPIGDSVPGALTIDATADILYFVTYIKAEHYLYKLNTSTGAFSVVLQYQCDPWDSWGSAPSDLLKVWQGDLYFYNCDSNRDYSLWKYETGYAPTKISFPGGIEMARYDFTYAMEVFNGSLYFSIGGDSDTGKIAVTDGNSAQYVTALQDFTRVRDLIAFDGKLIISGIPNAGRDDVYAFNGSGYSYVDQINDDYYQIEAENFSVVNGKLYFSAYLPSVDGKKQLYELDSTGNIRALELAQGLSGTYPTSIVGFQGNVYFAGFNDSDFTYYMHVYNGTSVLRLENFPALSKMGWSSTDRSIFASNGTLYFSGFIGAQSRSLWAFNGTDAPVAQTLTSATESHWISPHVYNNSLYIETTNFDEFSSKLYRLNEQNVPVLLPNLENSDFSYISVLSDGLYFWRKTEAEGTKLWKVGTNGVPQKFADTVIEDPWSRSDLLEVNGKIITAFDERMVAIDKSGQISFDQGDAMGVNDLTVVGNYVYFSAWSDADGVGTEIYRWNGTGASELIADVKEGGDGSNTDELISFNSKLYFTAEDGSETANQYYSEARFLFSLTENGTLTKLTEVTCSWDCSTESSIRDLEVVGSTMFAIADSDYGNRQLLKFNNNTNTFSSMKRNGENIVGVGSFGAGNSFTTIGTYVENVGCSVHKINADGSLVDIFNNVTDWCLYGYSWNPVIDFHGNYYFSYFSAQYGEELHMLPGAGTATKPNKVGSLALAKGGAKATSLKMSWKAPVLTGGKAITDYKVEYSLNGKKWTTFKHKASKLTSITITKLKKKTKYFVRVSAINAKGVGISSVVKVATK